MFRTKVEKAIRSVESWIGQPPEAADWQQVIEDCRTLLREIEREAVKAGLSDAVAACQVAGATTSVHKTRQVLADCLAACPEPETLSVAQVAQRLGVSKGAIYERCRDGRMPCTRVGTRIVITPEQLADYQRDRQLQQQLVGLRHLS